MFESTHLHTLLNKGFHTILLKHTCGKEWSEFPESGVLKWTNPSLFLQQQISIQNFSTLPCRHSQTVLRGVYTITSLSTTLHFKPCPMDCNKSTSSLSMMKFPLVRCFIWYIGIIGLMLGGSGQEIWVFSCVVCGGFPVAEKFSSFSWFQYFNAYLILCPLRSHYWFAEIAQILAYKVGYHKIATTSHLLCIG